VRVKEPPRLADGTVRSDFVSEFPLADIDPALRSSVELLDFGCGEGESLTNAARRFDVVSVGLDASPHKVRRARRKHLDVFGADVTTLEVGDFPALRFVNIDNVLEHMPTDEAAEVVVARACRLASTAVHIRHPSFEDAAYLARLGLKLYWNDWPTAHSAPLRVRQLIAMAGRAGVYRVIVHPVQRIRDSSDECLLPLDAPPNQRRRGKHLGVYDPEVHGPKPDVVLDRPVYFAFDVVLVTGETMPTIVYPGDPEITPARPRLEWPEPAPDELAPPPDASHEPPEEPAVPPDASHEPPEEPAATT
jgi:SAM-dependent methyltransferase